MAVTAARNTWSEQTVKTLYVPMAADAVIYQGAMVCISADGYAVNAADTANYRFAGICEADPRRPGVSTFDNSGGAAADMWVLLRVKGRARYGLGDRTPSQDMLMACVSISDNETVGVHPWDTVNDIRCGRIVKLPATTIALDPDADFAADEVEIEIEQMCYTWSGDVTTTTLAPTTTTTTQI